MLVPVVVFLLLACADPKPGTGADGGPGGETGADSGAPGDGGGGDGGAPDRAAGWEWGEVQAGDADATLEGSMQDEYAGAVIARVGDLDGDGSQDLTITHRRDGAHTATGVTGGLYVVRGSADGWGRSASLAEHLDIAVEEGFEIHRGVALGDVNGDGFDDMAIEEGYNSSGASASWLLLGGDRDWSGTTTTADLDAALHWDAETSALDWLDLRPEPGDLDGDGAADLLLTRTGNADPFVQVFTDLDTTLPATMPGDASLVGQVDGRVGMELTGLADLDLDGRPDLVAQADATSGLTPGARLFLGDWVSRGALDLGVGDVIVPTSSRPTSALLVGVDDVDALLTLDGQAGSARGLVARSTWPDRVEDADFTVLAEDGLRLRGIEDIDDVTGDGFRDLVIAATDLSVEEGAPGRLRRVLVAGGAGVLDGDLSLDDATTELPADVEADWYVSWAADREHGDIDGDGIADLRMARHPIKAMQLGQLHLWRGRATWPAQLGLDEVDLVVVADHLVADMREHLTADVNGDGYDDLVFGVPSDQDGDTYGVISVFYGQPFDG